MTQTSKKVGFRTKAVLLVLIILNFNSAIASASERREITPRTMLELTNASRKESGATELKFNDRLAAAAQAKADDMFSFQYFDHNSPSGITPWFWIKSSGYEYSFAGENLAIDFISAEGTHQAFMNSTSHRENILNTNYKEIGIAVKKGIFEGEESIIVVEEFGATLAVEIPAVSVSQAETQKSAEAKNIGTKEKENKKINSEQISDVQAEATEKIADESRSVVKEDAGNRTEYVVTDRIELEKPESENNLFVESLLYPSAIFEEEKICLGAKEDTDQLGSNNASTEKAAEEDLSADSYLAKRYGSLVSSSDSFKNEILLFALSITMTMNLVYISSENMEKNDL